MSNTVSVRVAKATRAGLARDRAHVIRSTAPAYVDPDRSPLNRTIVEPPHPAEAVALVERRRQEKWERGEYQRRPGPLRRDGVAALTSVITFGTEAQPTIDALDAGEADRLYRAAAEAVADELGVELTGLVVHADESAPHAHATFAGVTPAAEPVGRKLQPAMLSRLQDRVAEVFAEVGIERGKPVRQRRAEGEPDAQTVNRSVRQLHDDLPREIEAAEAEVKKQRQRAETARKKTDKAIAEGSEKIEKLKKRAETHERRLQQAEAEIERLRELAASALEDVPPPPTITITRQLDPGGLMKAARVERVEVVDPADAEHAARRSAEQVAVHSDRAQQQRERADALQQRVDTVDDAAKRWSLGAWERDALPGAESLIEATQRVTRYGVICATTDRQIAAPPQAATAKQIAAAIYSHGREQGWKRLKIQCQPEVQREILKMAAQDDRLHWVQGADPSIRAEVEAEPPTQKEREGIIPDHVPVVSLADDPDLDDDDLTPT